MIEYSVVIPVHNEGENLELFLSKFIGEISDTVKSVLKEIILVENGSSDDSWDTCQRLSNRFPDLVRSMRIDRPSYGEAIKRGMLASKGSHLSILECDFLDPFFVEKSIELFRSGNTHFIVASKRLEGSRDRRPFKRRLLTTAFNLILNIVFGYPGSDTRGLKSIETKLAKKLCHLSQTTAEIFQTEIVLLAWHLGYEVKELPIQVAEKRATPVFIHRRFLKVIGIVWELKKSLSRLAK